MGEVCRVLEWTFWQELDLHRFSSLGHCIHRSSSSHTMSTRSLSDADAKRLLNALRANKLKIVILLAHS